MPTPITINVNFIDLTGNAISGYMQASIVSPTGVYDLYVTGLGIILPKIQTSGIGTSVSLAVWGNDVVVDASDNAKDTFYTVNLFDTTNKLLWSASYLFTGAGPINLVGYPILNPVPAPPLVSNPIVTSPGGNNSDVQFNNGGFFGGVDAFAWNSANNELTVGSIVGLDAGTFSSITPQPTTSRFASIINGSIGNQYAIMAVGQATNSLVSSGVYSTTLANGTTDCNMFAVEADTYSAPSIAATQSFNGAIVTYAANKGPGTVTRMFSFAAETDCLGGTTTNNMGFWAIGAANSGTMHNNFGFHSDNQGAAGDTLSAAFHADAQTGSGFGFYSTSAPNFFGGTSATDAIQVINPTPATNVANQSSPILSLNGTYWTGSASAVNTWTLQDVTSAGSNPIRTLTLTGGTSSGGQLFSVIGAFQVSGAFTLNNNLLLPSNFIHLSGLSTPVILFQGNTPANSGANVSSGQLKIVGEYWTGSASADDIWLVSDILGSGTNPTSTFSITHSGTSGVSLVSVPGLSVTGATPTGPASTVNFGTTAGFGAGAAGTAVTTTTKGAGTGPTTAQTIVNYLEIDIAGTKYWIPLVQ